MVPDLFDVIANRIIYRATERVYVRKTETIDVGADAIFDKAIDLASISSQSSTRVARKNSQGRSSTIHSTSLLEEILQNRRIQSPDRCLLLGKCMREERMAQCGRLFTQYSKDNSRVFISLMTPESFPNFWQIALVKGQHFFTLPAGGFITLWKCVIRMNRALNHIKSNQIFSWVG